MPATGTKLLNFLVYTFLHCSKTTFERRLKRLMNKHIRHFHGSHASEEDNIDIEDELKDKNDEAITVYASYMSEIISAFVFFSKPNIEIDVIMPSIKDSTEKIIKMTKFFIEVKFDLFIHQTDLFCLILCLIFPCWCSCQMKRKI